MKQIQGSFIRGFVTIVVSGHMPEMFFQECVRRGITVWNIKRENKKTCSGNVKLSDLREVKRIRREFQYKISFRERKGFPFLFSRFFRRKEFVLSFIASIFFILFMSNIIWKVEITGELPKEIEEKISKQLNKYGVHPGAWIFTLDPPGKIQQKLTEDIPELLWVGVHQKGTTYHLEGVEKIVVKEDKVEGPRNIVAAKKGVIKRMYVSKGLPIVSINDYVEPGKVLVSGILNEVDNSAGNEDGKDKKKPVKVAAEGEIIASTWYEVDVTIPLKKNYELLTGKKEKKYFLGFNNFTFPVWGFGKPEFEAIHYDSNQTPIKFLKWELPIFIKETTLSEKQYHEIVRTHEEAVEAGIKQAKEELQLQLGPEAKIVSEKILHESVENGKVKLYLYMTVEENIAKAQPITQGD
ncbi:sporulation protein YqfD [Ornithinibacillus bavariensis]|uniref:sporulation protein YqfD n=1 Tax=Ornithinibacillus bavariensis TaxID=545502 RepID=UPI000EEC9EF6|nr:sporulation protein YqfD [Ornithinibacillus sp.]